MKKNLQIGFTLIELMVVVAIVGILATVAYPSYQDSIIKSKRAEGRAALMQIMQQQERYYTQNNAYSVFSKAIPNNFKWYSGDGATGSSYEIKAEACTDDTIVNCVMLTAMPGTANVNAGYADAACGDLSLASTGVKAASGTATNCW